jgi:transposase
MATERLLMHKVREILRFKWVLGLPHRETAKGLNVSAGAVAAVLARTREADLTWSEVERLSDEELERRLYGPRERPVREQSLPDPVWVHNELKRSGVTLELLHLEYLERYPDGYRYTSFCNHYRRWRKRCRPSMRQIHKAGEKMFCDFSGKRPCIVDRLTGEVINVELFVSVLGASNYTYVEAVRTQRVTDWIACHLHAFEYIGGVTAVVVPDQLKSGVTRACRYEPGLQRTYEDMARHYNTAVIPARPRKPKDKAKVEVGVQIAQRWILARLRDELFFSLADLNTRIWELLEDLNDRPMKTYGGKSRRQLFEELDKAQLRPLPDERYCLAEWAKARVNIDYHVEVERHFYSVPHALIHETLDVRLTNATIELLHKGRRVASHKRSDLPGRHTTISEHMPKSHQKHLEWTPTRLIHWAGTIGPSTQALVSEILASRPHPEMGYRSCLGILRLAKRYDNERLEAASARALGVGARSYRHIAAILKNGLDRVPQEEPETNQLPLLHENVRGPGYYQ